jgi:hypothetical protein
MAGCPRERDRTPSSDGNSQHHIGVLEKDAPLAVGVNATAFGGLRPALTPAPRRRAPSCRTPLRELPGQRKREPLDRPAPSCTADRGSVDDAALARFGAPFGRLIRRAEPSADCSGRRTAGTIWAARGNKHSAVRVRRSASMTRPIWAPWAARGSPPSGPPLSCRDRDRDGCPLRASGFLGDMNSGQR